MPAHERKPIVIVAQRKRRARLEGGFSYPTRIENNRELTTFSKYSLIMSHGWQDWMYI